MKRWELQRLPSGKFRPSREFRQAMSAGSECSGKLERPRAKVSIRSTTKPRRGPHDAHSLRTVKSLIRCSTALAALWATTTVAAEITDDGNFFSSGAIRSASEKIQDLDHRYGYRIKVETIAALPAGEVDEVRKMSAGDRAKFFGHLLAKRAAAEKLDLLIFASRDPKYLQVLPHKKLESAGFTTAMRDKMAAALIADFHTEKYDEALSTALTQLEQDFLTIHRKASAPDRPAQNRSGQNHPVENHAARQPAPFEHPPERPAAGGWFGPIMLVLLFVGGFLLIRRLIGGASGGSGPGNNMAGGGGGGGGMMGNILGGVFGAVAGNWLYDSFMRPTAHGQDFDHSRSDGGWGGSDSSSNTDDYSPDSYDTSGGGGDFGGGDSGGGDFGGGGDSGGDGGGGDF